MSSDIATVVYSYFFVIVAIGTGIGILLRHYVKAQQNDLKKELMEVKDQLNKIMYALYNDGRTGLINKVDNLLENQQCIRIDVEVLKAKAEE